MEENESTEKTPTASLPDDNIGQTTQPPVRKMMTNTSKKRNYEASGIMDAEDQQQDMLDLFDYRNNPSHALKRSKEWMEGVTHMMMSIQQTTRQNSTNILRLTEIMEAQ